MSVSAHLVKELRERTGAGMMDCRKALLESHGDIDIAIEAMRKSGQAKAAKKSSRVAAEGLLVVKTSPDHKCALMLEVNCETDFVARDDSFVAFANELATAALTERVKDMDQLNALSLAGKTVEQLRANLVSKIGENIQVRRMKSVTTDAGIVGFYIHGGGRIAVLVELEGGDNDLAKDIAMHCAAMSPQAVGAEDVPADLIAKEKAIFVAQAEQTGKPAEIIEKMVGGRIKKFLAEVSLEGQTFVRDPSKTVAALLTEKQAKVKSFCRFEVGEGIEKEEANFAEEVMATAKGS